MRDRRAERREATRLEILEAAWELAAASGLAGLSLRDIAREVGMQAPSLYSYFDSKNAIYDAMYAQASRQYLAGATALELTDEPRHDVRAIMRHFVGFAVENPVRYQLLFQRTIPGFEPSPESFKESVENLEELRAHFVRIGLDDPTALDLFTAIGTGLTDQQISNDPGGDRWARLVDDAAEMFCNHILNRTQPHGNRKAVT